MFRLPAEICSECALAHATSVPALVRCSGNRPGGTCMGRIEAPDAAASLRCCSHCAGRSTHRCRDRVAQRRSGNVHDPGSDRDVGIRRHRLWRPHHRISAVPRYVAAGRVVVRSCRSSDRYATWCIGARCTTRWAGGDRRRDTACRARQLRIRRARCGRIPSSRRGCHCTSWSARRLGYPRRALIRQGSRR